MIPLRDNIPSRSFPVVNYAMIAACTLVFLGQLAEDPQEPTGLVYRYGMIPAAVLNPGQPLEIEQPMVDVERGRVVVVRRVIEPSRYAVWTVLTCIFLHGGWMHFLGNMWFLHIFGDNVEDRLGHFGYALFYLAAGVLASVTHLATNSDSTVPTIGASGAIAGVMGAYFLFYPAAQVESLVPVFGFVQLTVIPAPVFLGIWFLMQLWQGAASSSGSTGVAWWAHIGGFVVGLAAAAIVRGLGGTNPPVETRRHYQYPRTYRWRA